MILKRSFVIGLASFLRQASLSIDRIPFNDLSSLLDFYKNASKHTPTDILKKLEAVIHRPATYEGDSKEELIHALRFGLKLAFMRDLRVTAPELYFVEKALKRLEELLANRALWQQKIVIDVRLEVAFAGVLLENKIHPRFEREAIGRVFHINHAEHLKLKSVETLAGKEWLEYATD
jgi:hypothetical protein